MPLNKETKTDIHAHTYMHRHILIYAHIRPTNQHERVGVSWVLYSYDLVPHMFSDKSNKMETYTNVGKK